VRRPNRVGKDEHMNLNFNEGWVNQWFPVCLTWNSRFFYFSFRLLWWGFRVSRVKGENWQAEAWKSIQHPYGLFRTWPHERWSESGIFAVTHR
jgi:hypothetical protein